jgi:hypothetical protein
VWLLVPYRHPATGVILLPVFVNHIVQSTVAVLQFVVYFVFMILLLVIFR